MSKLSPVLQAFIWMSGAIISFSAMAVAGREISFELDTFEIMMYRSAFGLSVVLCIAYMVGTAHQINRDNFCIHFIRNIFHFTGQNLWFYALTLIPLAQLFAFEFSTPLWIMLVAPFLLGERLTNTRILTIIIGFIGILLVTRPWVSGITLGVIPAALCAIGFAGTSIFTKKLTTLTTITCIMFWLTFLQLVFGLICAGFDGDIALPSSGSIPWLIVIGMGGLVAHFCITSALKVAPVTVVTPIDFCRLPLIAAIGYFIYGENLDIWIVLGAAVIFGANYFNILIENRKKQVAK